MPGVVVVVTEPDRQKQNFHSWQRTSHGQNQTEFQYQGNVEEIC